MKKIKLTLKPGSPGRTFFLFPSAEAVYVWLKDASALASIPGIEEVKLDQGEFIEAEWRGCEYSYEGQNTHRLDLIRLARAKPTQNASGLLVSINFGWTVPGDFPFSDCDVGDVEVRRLQPDERQLDLPTLFKDGDDGEDVVFDADDEDR